MQQRFTHKHFFSQEQGTYKSMGVTTARRLTELLGDPTYVNDKGIKCEYVVGANNDMEKTLRAIPVSMEHCAIHDFVSKQDFLCVMCFHDFCRFNYFPRLWMFSNSIFNDGLEWVNQLLQIRAALLIGHTIVSVF